MLLCSYHSVLSGFECVVTVCICSNILEGYQVLLCDCQGVLGIFFNVATSAAPLNSRLIISQPKF